MGKATAGAEAGRKPLPGAAADEVDDLEPISFDDRGRGPGRAGDDGAVVFDGDAIGFEREGGYKIEESAAGGQISKVTSLPIDDQFHEKQSTGSGGDQPRAALPE